MAFGKSLLNREMGSIINKIIKKSSFKQEIGDSLITRELKEIRFNRTMGAIFINKIIGKGSFKQEMGDRLITRELKEIRLNRVMGAIPINKEIKVRQKSLERIMGTPPPLIIKFWSKNFNEDCRQKRKDNSQDSH